MLKRWNIEELPLLNTYVVLPEDLVVLGVGDDLALQVDVRPFLKYCKLECTALY